MSPALVEKRVSKSSPEIRSESEYDFETDNDLDERDEMTLLELMQLNREAFEDAVIDDEPYVEMVRAILLHEDDDADTSKLLASRNGRFFQRSVG